MGKKEKFWEYEHPKVLFSEKNRMEWYPEAGILSIGNPAWGGPDGYPRPGKSVVLSIPAIAESEHKAAALAMFKQIVKILEE